MFKRAPSRPCNIFMRLRADDGEPAVFKDDKDRFTACVPPHHPAHPRLPPPPTSGKHSRAAKTRAHARSRARASAALTSTRLRRDINKTNTLKLRVDTDYLITLE